MDSARNPYTPNAGASPEFIAGRDAQTQAFRVLLERLSRGRTDQSMIVTGLRGVGKTVLLTEFADIARAQRWEVMEFEASKRDDSLFRQAVYSQLKGALLRLSPRARWSDRARSAAGVVSSFGMTLATDGTWSAKWDVDPSGGYADHGDLGLDLTDALLAVGDAAAEQGRGLALLIDEVQFLRASQLEALIQAVHKVVQRKLPVTFVGAGLPQIAELAGDAKSYAERLFRFPEIGSLSDEDARAAITEPAASEGVAFQPDAVDQVIRTTEGYPYFIQELGYQTWEIAEGRTITREDVLLAQEAYEAKLDSSFFRVRLDRATPLQTAYLRAMAGLGPAPQKAADVARAMGRESTQVGLIRAELIDMGLLFTPDYGYAAFTVPKFDQFMLRAVPDLVVPAIHRRRRRDADS